MPKDTEKYQYFTVGLLKSSFALEALKADATKHHMIEQPSKLIALRLTEYYDLLAHITPANPAVLASGMQLVASGLKNGSRNGTHVEQEAQAGGSGAEDEAEASTDEPENEIILASPDADQNADDAADYWATL